MGQPVKPLTHLQQLEAESIQIFREVAAEFLCAAAFSAQSFLSGQNSVSTVAC
jgi:hypothetical protein